VALHDVVCRTFTLLAIVGAGARSASAQDSLPQSRRRQPDAARYGLPPGAPYQAVNVIVPTPLGHTLAGTLTLPRGASARSRVAAVVSVSGSGPQDRDEEDSGLTGLRPFRWLADTLTRRGIAVLRMDDRGYGGSTGEYKTATTADFAEDIRAGLAYLRTRPEIDSNRLGLVGHSEGGLIGPMVAAKEPTLRAMALMAAPARKIRTILQFQLANFVQQDTALSPARKDSALARLPARIDSMIASDPWLAFIIDHDPLATMRQLKLPILLLNGGTDQQVTPDQASELGVALLEAGNHDVSVRVFPNLNHLFVYDTLGFPGLYDRLNPVIYPPAQQAVADWLVDRLVRPGRRRPADRH
jgi:dipeptidyl aminopeptidase/acylaminoacyl peptidase